MLHCVHSCHIAHHLFSKVSKRLAGNQWTIREVTPILRSQKEQSHNQNSWFIIAQNIEWARSTGTPSYSYWTRFEEDVRPQFNSNNHMTAWLCRQKAAASGVRSTTEITWVTCQDVCDWKCCVQVSSVQSVLMQRGVFRCHRVLRAIFIIVVWCVQVLLELSASRSASRDNESWDEEVVQSGGLAPAGAVICCQMFLNNSGRSDTLRADSPEEAEEEIHISSHELWLNLTLYLVYFTADSNQPTDSVIAGNSSNTVLLASSHWREYRVRWTEQLPEPKVCKQTCLSPDVKLNH